MTDRSRDPRSPDFWPAELHRDGDVATARQMAAVFAEWDGIMTRAALAGLLRRAGASRGEGCWPFHRLADSMIERAREAGLVRWDGRRWHHITDTGKGRSGEDAGPRPDRRERSL